jgi:hypothetical protein
MADICSRLTGAALADGLTVGVGEAGFTVAAAAGRPGPSLRCVRDILRSSNIKPAAKSGTATKETMIKRLDMSLL